MLNHDMNMRHFGSKRPATPVKTPLSRAFDCMSSVSRHDAMSLGGSRLYFRGYKLVALSVDIDNLYRRIVL